MSAPPSDEDTGSLGADQEQNPLPGVIGEILGVPEPQPLIPGLILAIEEPEQYQHPDKAQRLFGSSEATLVTAGTRIEEAFACLERNLEKTIEDEFGTGALLAAIDSCKERFSIQKNEDAIKSPAAMEFTLTKLTEQGLRSPSLELILEKIRALKAKSLPLPA